MASSVPNIRVYYHGVPTPHGYSLQLLGSSDYDAPVEDIQAGLGWPIVLNEDASMRKHYRPKILTCARRSPALAYLWDKCMGDIIVRNLNNMALTNASIDCSLVNISHEPDTKRDVVLIVVASASTWSQTQAVRLATLIATEANSVLLGFSMGEDTDGSESRSVVVEIASLSKLSPHSSHSPAASIQSSATFIPILDDNEVAGPYPIGSSLSSCAATKYGSSGGVFELTWKGNGNGNGDENMNSSCLDFVLTCHHVRQGPHSSVEIQVQPYDIFPKTSGSADLKGCSLLETVLMMKPGHVSPDIQVPSAPHINATIRKCEEQIIHFQSRLGASCSLDSKINHLLSRRKDLLNKLRNMKPSLGLCINSSGFQVVDGFVEDWMVGFLLDGHNLTNDFSPSIPDTNMRMAFESFLLPDKITELAPNSASDGHETLYGTHVVKSGATSGFTIGCVNGFKNLDIEWKNDSAMDTIAAATKADGKYTITEKSLQVIGDGNMLFSAPGDSGAAVIDMQGRHTGIINAGIIPEKGIATEEEKMPGMFTLMIGIADVLEGIRNKLGPGDFDIKLKHK